VPGRPLTAALGTGDLSGAAAVTGAMLAALHASAVAVPERVTLDGTLAEMRKKAAKLAAGHPAVERVARQLVSGAARRRDAVVRERACALHGDFHLDQLVTSDEGPVLVDLDSMVTGPPEVDLAEFLVDLALRGLPGAVAAGVADGLWRSYTRSARSDVDGAALEVFADAEFLNRCYRHLRRHTPGWERDLEDELGRYDEVAALVRQ
jgi:aminoglycoside phosphotransferase (APT) family kinase protein